MSHLHKARAEIGRLKATLSCCYILSALANSRIANQASSDTSADMQLVLTSPIRCPTCKRVASDLAHGPFLRNVGRVGRQSQRTC